MDFFFYSVIALLIILFPFYVTVRGSIDVDRRIVGARIKLFGIKLLSIKVFFSDDGVFISINGKKGKELKTKRSDNNKKMRFDPVAAVRIRSLSLSVSVAGDPSALSFALGSALSALSAALAFLECRGVLDKARLRVIPRYSGGAMAVNFSISLFFSVAMLFGGLIHTTRGEKV